MKSPYISELQANETIHGVFLVAHKDIRQKKSGDPYLSLTLSDRTGDLDAKMFDNASDSLDTFDCDDFVRVKGLLQVFHNRPQLSIHKIQPVPDTEVDTADFFPASKRDRDEMFRELQTWIAGVANPHIKALLDAMFADQSIAIPYRSAPAAKSVHHNWIGGLIEHVLSMCHIARFTAAHYPGIDFDLLLAGVLLHDIGKVRELSFSRSIAYTSQGQLLGHIMIGVGMIEEKLRGIPDFPAPIRDLLLHMIISHHGELEYGSPKVPVFPEALLLHQIDNLDSKMECMRALIEKDRLVDGEWTVYSSALDRSALKKSKFLEPPQPAHKAEASVAAAVSPKPQPQPSSPFAAKLINALRRE
ncbi:MAG: HD domain-containing protein [Bryobacterales bacterium]|nr:HD domain-containing protein [Bryobacterales bacterium]MBV9397361.1 HD domain-containing protein [Bryobacterales bacterium]